MPSVGDEIELYLQDEILKFGTGRRKIIIDEIGRKWVRLRTPFGKKAKISRALWVQILTSNTNLNIQRKTP